MALKNLKFLFNRILILQVKNIFFRKKKPCKPLSRSVRYSQIRLSFGREDASHFTIFSVPYNFLCSKSWHCIDDSHKDWDFNHSLHCLHQDRTEQVVEQSLVFITIADVPQWHNTYSDWHQSIFRVETVTDLPDAEDKWLRRSGEC